VRSKRAENGELQKPSKTKRKKEAMAAQRLGEALVVLSAQQLDKMGIPEELHEAIVAVRQMHQRGARRRQMQYIGALMRTIDISLIQRNIEKVTAQRHEETRRFRQVELWRDELTAGDERRLSWIMETFPDIDREALDKMVGAVTEAKGVPERRRSKKALFRFLRGLIE